MKQHEGLFKHTVKRRLDILMISIVTGLFGFALGCILAAEILR